MNRIVPIMFMLLIFAGCANPAQPSVQATIQQASYRQISMDDAIAMMEAELDYILLDVRTAAEFAEKHIPGAINIANEDIGTEEIPELPDLDQLILVYCRSGNRSKQASQKLAELGYRNVVEFGGINSWPGDVVSGN